MQRGATEHFHTTRVHDADMAVHGDHIEIVQFLGKIEKVPTVFHISGSQCCPLRPYIEFELRPVEDCGQI